MKPAVLLSLSALILLPCICLGQEPPPGQPPFGPEYYCDLCSCGTVARLADVAWEDRERAIAEIDRLHEQIRNDEQEKQNKLAELENLYVELDVLQDLEQAAWDEVERLEKYLQKHLIPARDRAQAKFDRASEAVGDAKSPGQRAAAEKRRDRAAGELSAAEQDLYLCELKIGEVREIARQAAVGVVETNDSIQQVSYDIDTLTDRIDAANREILNQEDIIMGANEDLAYFIELYREISSTCTCTCHD